MRLTGFDLLMWAAGFLGHVTLLAVLLFRGRAREFPFFTGLIAWSIFRSIRLFWIMYHRSPSVYFDNYWILSVVDTFLQLCIIYELAAHTFGPSGKWEGDAFRKFLLILAGSAAIAAGISLLSTPPYRNWRQIVVVKGSFFATTWMSELFIGMIALSVVGGLPWRTHVAKISQGLGIYSLFDMLIEVGHSYFGAGHQSHAYRILSRMRIEAYLCCLVYWILMLWRDAPPSRGLTPVMQARLVAVLKSVEYDLQKLRSWASR